uniref:GRF-type domain-containing protein n=1 Tax=Brassica oleracea var. oleracea TaxID=109376 RepID=A0A0D3E8L6_BRAOL
MAETNYLPRRMFALGHEPVGLRVSPYHKPGALGHIIDSLEEGEIEVLKRSPFGRFLELADKTPYSGHLGRYKLSRQLKVLIVPGLPCGKYPKKPQKEAKKKISEQPYYTTLFGMLKEVTATSVIRMLKRKTITDPDARIKDFDEFFAYPWGRVSFEMLMSSIKERDEVALTQSTITLQGYVQSLHMVMTKAVPALTELVRQDSPTDAAGDDDDDDSVDKMVSLIRDGAHFTKKLFIGGATSADVERMREEAEAEALAKKKKKRKTPCQTIPTPTQAPVDAELIASLVQAKIKRQIDRVEGKVDDLRESFDQLQENGFKTILDSIASLSSQSHSRSVEDNPMADAPVADSNGQPQTRQPNPNGLAEATEYINFVVASVQNTHGDTTAGGSRTQTTIPEPQRATSRGYADMVNEDTNINQKTSGEDDANGQGHVEEQNVARLNLLRDFQLSEAESGDERVSAEDDEPNVDNEAPPIVTEDHQPDAAIPIRKSTRLKAVTKSLVGVYECDNLIQNRFREAQLGAISWLHVVISVHRQTYLYKSITIGGISVSNKGIIDIADRSRAPSFKKEDFVFTPNVLETLRDPESQTFESLHFYLPFNFDKNYWVGICVDSTTWTLIVLDSNASLRSDSDLKALAVERPRNIPQNIKTTDSGVTTTLLMQAHAAAGIEVCKSLTSDVLDHEAKTLAVMLYEENILLIQAMEVFSPYTLSSNRVHSKKCCLCGYPSLIKKSWTDKNPCRLFLGCARYQEVDGCNFFEWYDLEEVRGWPKRSLIEARDEIRAKDLEIRRLTNIIAKLRRELDNHRLAEARTNQLDVVHSRHNSQNDDDHEPNISVSERLICRLSLN